MSIDRLKSVTAGPNAGAHTEPETSCTECAFFKARTVPNSPTLMGRCRRNPGGLIVEAGDWCGEHRPIAPPRAIRQ
jgi:hypothetical protein